MIRKLQVARFWLRMFLFLGPLMSFWAAAFLRFRSGLFPINYDIDAPPYFALLLFETILWVILVEHYECSAVENLFSLRLTVQRSLMPCIIAFMGTLAVTFFYRTITFSRLMLSLSLPLLWGWLLFSTWLMKTIAGVTRDARTRILIIGADEYARELGRRLEASPLVSCSVAGYVALSDQDSSDAIPIDKLPEFAFQEPIHEAVIALEPHRLTNLRSIAEQLECLSVPIRSVLDLGDGVVVRDRLFDFGGTLMLNLVTTPAESMDYVLAKRVFDVAFSLAALTIVGPLMLLIALAIKLTSSGPILFRQERVGLNGQLFTMLKFRTMQVQAKDESDKAWTTQTDARRTWVGAFLRRASLDELPQFLNVLHGDMSVVGPRPERPYFVKQFQQRVAKYNTRHALKVGITGWAQVNGWRGDTSISRRVEFDRYYMENWSLMFDLRIILLTVWRGFAGKGAY